MAEPWIRVHANLRKKPVVGRLSSALKVSRNEAVGLLVGLWGGLSMYGENGNVASVPDDDLEEWAGWRGKRGRFADWVRGSHVDDEGRIREWNEYAGALETRREKERERKRAERERKEAERLSRGLSAARHADDTQDNGVTGGVTSASGPGNVATRARETTTTTTTKQIDVDDARAGVPDDGAHSAVLGEPSLTALWLVIWANNAITERWGEQPNPLVNGSHAVELAGALVVSGVSWQVAKASVFSQCRKSKNKTPPMTVRYFERGILVDWEREQARRAVVAANDAAPPSVESDPASDAARLDRWARETDEREAQERAAREVSHA